MQNDKELHDALARFIGQFEYVFDGEWNDFSKDLLFRENVDSYISPGGTFLNPKVDDEYNNWANRGSLLDIYRELVSVMKKRGIYIEHP